jgi:hypothetical protein
VSDEMPFKDKIKTLHFMDRSGAGNRSRDLRHPTEGYRMKETREGDPDAGYVTHTEHAKGDRVDAVVAPKTLKLTTTTQG